MFELSKEDFLSMREDGFTFKEIGEFYNLTERQINYRTKKWGLDYSKAKKVDNLFFSSGTKAAYYWAGFIAADGYIEEDRNRLGIGLQVDDWNHLEKFKQCVKSDHDICLFMKNAACRIRFNSEQIIKDLRSIFNITGTKTFTYSMPIIEEEYLLLEFLRGYIDGDGHYEVKPSKSVTIQLCSAQKSFLIEFKEIVEHLINRPIMQAPSLQINKKGQVWSIVLNVLDSRDLIKLLYKNSTHLTRLTRKYDKIQHIL